MSPSGLRKFVLGRRWGLYQSSRITDDTRPHCIPRYVDKRLVADRPTNASLHNTSHRSIMHSLPLTRTRIFSKAPASSISWRTMDAPTQRNIVSSQENTLRAGRMHGHALQTDPARGAMYKSLLRFGPSYPRPRERRL